MERKRERADRQSRRHQTQALIDAQRQSNAAIITPYWDRNLAI